MDREDEHFQSPFEEFAGKVCGRQVPRALGRSRLGPRLSALPVAAGAQRAELQTLGFQPGPIMCHLALSEAGRLFLCFGRDRVTIVQRPLFFLL